MAASRLLGGADSKDGSVFRPSLDMTIHSECRGPMYVFRSARFIARVEWSRDVGASTLESGYAFRCEGRKLWKNEEQERMLQRRSSKNS
jgi:hypothetical protein